MIFNFECLPEVLRRGRCPFTGARYDCGRCEWKPVAERGFGWGRLYHSALVMTRLVETGDWKDFLSYFNDGGRGEAKKILVELIFLGVRKIPVWTCDLEHFCFRRGCQGHQGEEFGT